MKTKNDLHLSTYEWLLVQYAAIDRIYGTGYLGAFGGPKVEAFDHPEYKYLVDYGDNSCPVFCSDLDEVREAVFDEISRITESIHNAA